MAVTTSAPGKLVLFGDHAAVYGEPCLVTAVDLRFSVTIDVHDEAVVEISTPDLRARNETYRVSPTELRADNRRDTAFVEAALKQVFQHYSPTLGMKVTTDGPRITYGLGSSSAITAATIAAAAHTFGLRLSQRDIFDLAYAAVIEVQGTGSGVDLAAAIYGGTVYYVNRGEIIEQLAAGELPLVIGYSGAKVSTTNLIAHVAALRERQPRYIESLLEMLGAISTDARDTIIRADWSALGELADIHQGILDAFGVNTPQLANLVFAARGAGALGAKLSGAGGGDCMFALTAPEDQHRIEQSIEQADGLVVRARSSVDGVRVDSP